MTMAIMPSSLSLGLLLLLCCLVSNSAFGTPLVVRLSSCSCSCSCSCSSTILYSTPPRQPRRNLKKRRKRRDRQPAISEEQEFPWETAESRSLVSSRSKEAGEDYWIDEDDLLRSIQKTQAIKNRKAMEGEMPKEKLWIEVFAPYKQNWIGIFSMFIVILATIVTKFPELLNQPIIPIPDL